jgi:hypothetical protein
MVCKLSPGVQRDLLLLFVVIGLRAETVALQVRIVMYISQEPDTIGG